jgi:hypothetical protein
MCTPTIVGIALTALPRHASAHLDGVLNEPRSSSDRMLLSRAGLAGAPAIKLGSPMNVEMPLAELDDLARSARALELHAAGPASPMGPPPGIDQLYGVRYLVFDVAPPLRDHALGGPSGCSRGRLEATAAVLTGAASIWTTERLLRVCLAPPAGHLQDSLASPSTSGMMRTARLPKFHGPGSKPLGSAFHAPG